MQRHLVVLNFLIVAVFACGAAYGIYKPKSKVDQLINQWMTRQSQGYDGYEYWAKDFDFARNNFHGVIGWDVVEPSQNVNHGSVRLRVESTNTMGFAISRIWEVHFKNDKDTNFSPKIWRVEPAE